MAVIIDSELCNSCGMCVNSCPMDVIRMEKKTKKAVTTYPDDCVQCGMCALDCPTKAIIITPIKTAPLMVSWG